jgi:hypothetical protein
MGEAVGLAEGVVEGVGVEIVLDALSISYPHPGQRM